MSNRMATHCCVRTPVLCQWPIASARRVRAAREVVGDSDNKVGADGAHSAIARLVRAVTYCDKPQLSVGYYAYWSDFPRPSRSRSDASQRSIAATVLDR